MELNQKESVIKPESLNYFKPIPNDMWNGFKTQIYKQCRTGTKPYAYNALICDNNDCNKTKIPMISVSKTNQ